MASSPTPLHPAAIDPADTLGEQALRHLGLDARNPATHVLALLARKYELDPLLNEVAVIRTGQGLRPYITRDGMLTIAHRSGQLDGIVVDDVHEGETGWGATVTVWRKDMTHGFTYSAGCGKAEPQGKQGHGPEMALARAERRALHRAFAIPSSGGDWDDEPAPPTAPPDPPPAALSASPPGDRATDSPPKRTPSLAARVPVPPTPDSPAQPVAWAGLSDAERRAMALISSRGRTADIAALRGNETVKLGKFLDDIGDGAGTIEQLDDTRWQYTGPGPGGYVWWYQADLERGTATGEPVEQPEIDNEPS